MTGKKRPRYNEICALLEDKRVCRWCDNYSRKSKGCIIDPDYKHVEWTDTCDKFIWMRWVK